MDPYKKYPLIRDGNISQFTYEDGGRTTEKTKHIVELPIPPTGTVPTYLENLQNRVSSKWESPVGYVRRPQKTTSPVDSDDVDYDLQLQDEKWLNNSRWGTIADAGSRLNTSTFERILDLLEKENYARHGSALEHMGVPECEKVLVPKLMASIQQFPLPSQASPGTPGFSRLITDIHGYWVSKRMRLQKPLVRAFWPITNPSDTNAHLTFRPAERTIRNLRRTRRNDIETIRKLTNVRSDLDRALLLFRNVLAREDFKRDLSLITHDLFEQALYELGNTTGSERTPSTLSLSKKQYAIPAEKLRAVPRTHLHPTPTPVGGLSTPHPEPAEAARRPAQPRKDTSAAALKTAQRKARMDAAPPANVRRAHQYRRPVATGAPVAAAPVGVSAAGAVQAVGAPVALGANDRTLPQHAQYLPLVLGNWTPPRSLSIAIGRDSIGEEGIYLPADVLGVARALGLRMGAVTTPATIAGHARSAFTPVLLSRASYFPMDSTYPRPLVGDLYTCDASIQRRILAWRHSGGRGGSGYSWEESWHGNLVAGLGAETTVDGFGWFWSIYRVEAESLPLTNGDDRSVLFVPSKKESKRMDDTTIYSVDALKLEEVFGTREQSELQLRKKRARLDRAHEQALLASFETFLTSLREAKTKDTNTATATTTTTSKALPIAVMAAPKRRRVDIAKSDLRLYYSTVGDGDGSTPLKVEFAVGLAPASSTVFSPRHAQAVATLQQSLSPSASAPAAVSTRLKISPSVTNVSAPATNSISLISTPLATLSQLSTPSEPSRGEIQKYSSALRKFQRKAKTTATGKRSSSTGLDPEQIVYRPRLDRSGRVVIDLLPALPTNTLSYTANVIKESVQKRNLLVAEQQNEMLMKWGLHADSRAFQLMKSALPVDTIALTDLMKVKRTDHSLLHVHKKEDTLHTSREQFSKIATRGIATLSNASEMDSIGRIISNTFDAVPSCLTTLPLSSGFDEDEPAADEDAFLDPAFATLFAPELDNAFELLSAADPVYALNSASSKGEMEVDAEVSAPFGRSTMKSISGKASYTTQNVPLRTTNWWKMKTIKDVLGANGDVYNASNPSRAIGPQESARSTSKPRTLGTMIPKFIPMNEFTFGFPSNNTIPVSIPDSKWNDIMAHPDSDDEETMQTMNQLAVSGLFDPTASMFSSIVDSSLNLIPLSS